MAKFKLLSGQHIAADKSKPITGPDGKPTGRFEKKVYKAGHVIESDVDLVARSPHQYELVGGEDEARLDEIAKLRAKVAALEAEKAGAVSRSSADNPSVAPGGQVSSGFQSTSGPMSAEEAAAHGGKVDGAAADDEKAVPAEDHPAATAHKKARK